MKKKVSAQKQKQQKNKLSLSELQVIQGGYVSTDRDYIDRK